MGTVLIAVGLVHLAILLAVAGVGKIVFSRTFAAQLAMQGVLPALAIGVISRLVPLIEISMAIWLVSGLYPGLASLSTGVLLAGFLFYRAILPITKSRENPCGCFGGWEAPHDVPGAEIAGIVVNLGIALAIFGVVDTSSAIFPSMLPFVFTGALAVFVLGVVAWHLMSNRVIRRTAEA